MNKESISLRIKQNFKDAGWQIEDLRIQPDPFIGWWIVIVSPDFEGKSRKERKEKALAGLEDLKIEWLELLSPEEKEYAGSLPIDSDALDLPLWPEALARGSLFEPGKEPIHFLSEIDEDIEPPIIATFYSLRGGVGRSTALAYTAHILASKGRKVICVDMDLEAPGITALFGKEKDIKEDMGLIHLLMGIDQGETPDITKHLLRISESYDLYCLPAGKPDANYARLLRYIHPEAWYREERNPLHELFDQLSKNLPFTPEVILLDARTGITQMSGPLLFDLSDISVIVFFPHQQAFTGTEVLVKALLAAKTRRKINGITFVPEVRFLVSPLPSSNIKEMQRYKRLAIEWISGWISPWKISSAVDQDILESDITHFVPYREVIATSDQILTDEDIWGNYLQVSEWIERFLETPTEKNITERLAAKKIEILENISFSTGTAELQKDFLDTFVETELVRKALSPAIPLVLGRKGTGKTAVFRRLSEGEKANTFVITAPPALTKQHRMYLSVSMFKTIEEILENLDADWREFWIIYICLVIYYSLSEKENTLPAPPANAIKDLLKSKPTNEQEIVNLIERMMQVPRYGLVAQDWLSQLDKLASEKTMLLFDGLDTGFGNTDKDRNRRKTALEGLFTFATDTGSRLNLLKLKILLREDIWKDLEFENKSHFYGQSQLLRWVDPVAFFKVIIKQAIRNKFFKKLLEEVNLPLSQPVEYWEEQLVISAWNLLVGERMKGGKTAFTRNWVWKRLSDGNNDRSPRYLLQLMHEAVEWEKKELKRTSYERSIIRPRALIRVLPEVSEQALGALRDEEFPELIPLMDNLTEIGRTPINATDITVSSDLVNLAMDVGLLGIYEGSEEKVERYKVPEIFRHALKMTRKGQM